MKNKLRTAIVFLTGVFVTTCFFQFVYPPAKDATAGDLTCIRNGLVAKLYTGNVGENQEFSMAYAIPACISSSGYKLKRTWIYEGQYVAVTYYNPNFSKASSFGSGSSGGGGMVPLN